MNKDKESDPKLEKDQDKKAKLKEKQDKCSNPRLFILYTFTFLYRSWSNCQLNFDPGRIVK